MTKITTMDRTAAKAARVALEAALKNPAVREAFDVLGLTASVGNASFDGSQVTFKVSLAIPGKLDPSIASLARAYGLDASKTAKDGFKIVGMGRGKMPWLLADADGRRIKAATDWCLKFGLAADGPAITPTMGEVIAR